MNFNSAHWHLLVNHLPITGGIIAFLVLAYGILRKTDDVIKAAYWLFTLIAVFSVAATQTGEGAEHMLLNAKLADEVMIERHVEASNIAQWCMIAVGLASLAALFVKKLQTVKIMPVLVLLLALVATGLMAWAGLLGGEIMHKEIRGEITAVFTNVLPDYDINMPYNRIDTASS